MLFDGLKFRKASYKIRPVDLLGEGTSIGMRFRVRFILFLSFLLVACSRAPSNLPLKTVPPPRFSNFETDANVKSLALDGDDLWLGMANGVIRYNTKTIDQHEIFTAGSTGGFLSNGIYKIAVDAQGNKWIGTYGGGLSRFDGHQWTVFTPYGSGKISYGQDWSVYPSGSGLGDLWVYDIFFDSDGTLWLATWKGVSHFDGRSFRTYTQQDGLLDKWVYSIAKDRNGVFWFGTEGGVSRFDGRHWTGYTHRDGLGAEVNESPPKEGATGYAEGRHHRSEGKENRLANPNFVLHIAIDQADNKWIGTWGAGLSRFNGKTWVTYTAGKGTISGNFIHALEIDAKGILWAGTENGVSKFDGRTWKTYTTADGLIDNNVFSIAFDAEGNKWFGTWLGLSKMTE